MLITSEAFVNNGLIPKKYTCDGDNVNPPLNFINIPSETKSMVLIVDDPDAPAGTWVHWTMWNISPPTFKIKEGSIPEEAIEGQTSFNKTGYGGPCPPNGVHRYFFKLYALDTNLNLLWGSDWKTLENAIKGHILEEAVLIGLYGK